MICVGKKGRGVEVKLGQVCPSEASGINYIVYNHSLDANPSFSSLSDPADISLGNLL